MADRLATNGDSDADIVNKNLAHSNAFNDAEGFGRKRSLSGSESSLDQVEGTGSRQDARAANLREMGPLRLLFVYADSVYSHVWKELIVYYLVYMIISLTQRYGMNEAQSLEFAKAVRFMRGQLEGLPAPLMGFVIGFYVSQIAGQWWAAYESIPWIDSKAAKIAYLLPGTDAKTTFLRRETLRTIHAMSAITFGELSPQFEDKISMLRTIARHGGDRPRSILTAQELKRIRAREARHGYSPHWAPCKWLFPKLRRAEAIGLIDCRKDLEALLGDHQEACRKLLKFKWIRLPLAYSQVVILLVYFRMIANLIARQYLPSEGADELWLPVDFQLAVEFLIFVGWVKVAVAMFYPFGDDKDDFDLEGIMTRNIVVGDSMIEPLNDWQTQSGFDFNDGVGTDALTYRQSNASEPKPKASVELQSVFLTSSASSKRSASATSDVESPVVTISDDKDEVVVPMKGVDSV